MSVGVWAAAKRQIWMKMLDTNGLNHSQQPLKIDQMSLPTVTATSDLIHEHSSAD